MRLDRLLGITMELLSKKKMTASELAEKYEVSVRTIYRDMESISMAGIPIKATTGTAGGFEIMPGYFLSKNYFSLQELGLMYHFFKAIGSVSDHTPFDGVTQKLSALNNQLDETAQVIFKTVATEKESQNIMIFHQAVLESEVLTMQYTDSKGIQTKRHILPYHLIWEDSSWYLEAYCILRKGKRYFKLARIQEVKKSGQFIKTKPEFQEKAEASGFKTILLFDPSVQSRVNDQFFNEWTKTEDGLILEAEFYDKHYALSVILSYANNVKIIKPDWLKEELISVLKDIQGNYKEE